MGAPCQSYIYNVFELKDAPGPRKPLQKTFIMFLSSRMLRAREKALYLLRVGAQECSGPKSTITFTPFLRSRMLRAQENQYIYNAFEFNVATGPRKPVYL